MVFGGTFRTAVRRALCCAAALVVLVPGLDTARAQKQDAWCISWASSQLQPYGTEVLPENALNGTTLRQVVHLSLGGTEFRLRLSNTFGNKALRLRSVHISQRATAIDAPPGAAMASTDRTVTFNHGIGISIPPGGEYVSDPIVVPVAPLSDLLVSMLIDSAPEAITFHAGAHATAFLAPGDHVADPSFVASQTFTRWYFLSGVEVFGGTRNGGAVVTLGDSITDGHASTTDGNDRWPDVLARRLSGPGSRPPVAVINEGIGGNCILQQCLGPSALARFDRDVLSLPGGSFLILMEGTNDLGSLDRTEEHSQGVHDALVLSMEQALEQMTAQAHEHGLRVYGATLTPFLGSDYYHPSARTEADRVALNEWIRSSAGFDSVIDFDKAVSDPAKPDHMLSAYDSGDHLHPGPAGYKRMGEFIPLKLFKR